MGSSCFWVLAINITPIHHPYLYWLIIDLLQYSHTTKGIDCYCNTEVSNNANFVDTECLFSDYSCAGSRCYARREKVDNVYTTKWNCLSDQNLISEICTEQSHNTDTKQYSCCSDANCNNGVYPELPVDGQGLRQRFKFWSSHTAVDRASNWLWTDIIVSSISIVSLLTYNDSLL